MNENDRTRTAARPLAKIGKLVLVCAVVTFVIVYVAVGILKPGSRAQRDVLMTVNGVGVVASAPSPRDVMVKPLLDYAEKPGGKAK